MKRIAAPMIGGMVTSTLLTLLVIPSLYALWRGRRFTREKVVQRTVVEESAASELPT